MMQRFSPIRYARRLLAALLAVTALCAPARAADLAGSVSFVIGDATVVDVNGSSHPVARGDKIDAGQTLVTGSSGHIHVTMVDKAFLSVRPQSRLKIQDYHYDAAVPANNRIKFVLEQGVARSITGRGGEASRENYRLNTPLAAIGIRGTDFVVHANADVTRVYVQTGAVVVSPFGDGCLASAFGPCISASTRVLTAAMNNAYLELRSRTEVPLLVPIDKGLEPNTVAPPRPEEPRPAVGDKQSKAGISFEARDVIRDAAADTLKSKVDVAAIPAPVPEKAPALVTPGTPAVVVVVPVPVAPPAAQFWWGRWSAYITPGQEAQSLIAAYSVKPGERDIAAGNDVFGVLREKGDYVMPASGIAKFALADAEAYYMSPGKLLAAAAISSPSLLIDFGAGRYDTSLALSASGMTPVTVQSSGSVTTQGQMLSDGNAATALSGFVSRDTSQATYVFDRAVSGNVSVVGATRWAR